MAKNGMNTKRYSLVFATAVAFCTVCAAGVSTFAWFQANAAASVSTTSDEAEITVVAPDPLEAAFYVYVGNGGTRNSTSSTASAGYEKYWQKSISAFGTDFYQISESSTPTNSATALAPGRRLTYCIRLSGEGAVGTNGTHSAYITGVTDNGGRSRYLYDGTTTSTLVKLGWAINVYATCITTATDAVPSASDIQTFIRADGTDVFEDSPSGEDHSDAIATATSATTKHFYFFYTIEFSNVNTTFFHQVDDGGAPVELGLSPTSDTTTYWERYSLGDSEVYSGLAFAITEITLV